MDTITEITVVEDQTSEIVYLVSDIGAAIERIETILEARHVISIAKAAETFYAAQGLEENAQKAREVSLRAQRKAGQILKVMPKNTGSQGLIQEHLTGGSIVQPPVDNVPTLADLDIDRHESHRWQLLAEVPEKMFDQHIDEKISKGYELTTGGLISIAKRRRKEAKREREYPSYYSKVDDSIILGDMREVGQQIPDSSVDLIFTDLPYEQEYLSLFSDLSKFALRVLKPGGLCLTYSGQIFLPEVYARLGESLEYLWTFAVRHTGGAQRIFRANVNTAWKPVLAYVKSPLSIYWDNFIDVVSGGMEKDLHEWQQSEAEAAYFIKHLTSENGLVVDPFCGSGTALVAAKKLGRRYIGIEIEKKAALKASERLQ